MTKPETPGRQFVAALLGVDARERPKQPKQQADQRLGWWRDFWTAIAGGAGAVDDLARSRPSPDQAARPESRDRDDPDEVVLESPPSTERRKPRPERAPAEELIPEVGADPSIRRWRVRRFRHAADQELARRVQDILVGCGLSQADFSIAGGRVVNIPQVVSVVAGPPVGLNIRMLPGQMPDDYAAHARRIAYNLDVAEVRVSPLGPQLIRLELLPKPHSARPSAQSSPGRRRRGPPSSQ